MTDVQPPASTGIRELLASSLADEKIILVGFSGVQLTSLH